MKEHGGITEVWTSLPGFQSFPSVFGSRWDSDAHRERGCAVCAVCPWTRQDRKVTSFSMWTCIKYRCILTHAPRGPGPTSSRSASLHLQQRHGKEMERTEMEGKKKTSVFSWPCRLETSTSLHNHKRMAVESLGSPCPNRFLSCRDHPWRVFWICKRKAWKRWCSRRSQSLANY